MARWRREAGHGAISGSDEKGGDLDGCAVWRGILRAVEELQGTKPKSGEAVD